MVNSESSPRALVLAVTVRSLRSMAESDDLPGTSGPGQTLPGTLVSSVDPLSPPSTSGYAPSPPEAEPEVVNPSPPTSNLGSLSLSADSQPVDAQAAAIYAAKGKAKVSRHISGTGIDVENAVQRELQPGERSLDQGE